MPDAEGPEGVGEQDKLAPPGGSGDEAPEDKAREGGTPEDEADAVERLKARAGRRSSRRGGGKRASTRGNRSSRRRLSDEERQAVWQKAVARKARKIKLISDSLIFICLLCILGAHALVFAHMRANVGGGDVTEYGPKRGYEVMLDLVNFGRTSPDAPFVSAGTKPHILREGTSLRVFEAAAPADAFSMLILIVPLGAALLLLLYLLDYLVWMGRPLPVLSLLYGFASVAYLMITRVSTNGTWSIIGMGGYEAMTAWFMLLIPLFLLGTFSMLRFLFSARRKRYSFAGKEPPSVPEPPKPPAGKDEAESEDESEEETEDESGDKADSPADAPADGPADLPGGPAAPDAGPDALDVTSEARKTPVSSPAIKLDLTGGGDDADDDAGPDADADADEGPVSSPFD